jgi:hypothetical protein
LQTAQTQILLLQGIGVDPLGAQASQITTLTTTANSAITLATQEKIDRANADTVLQNSINALNASISGINSSLSNETSARVAADLGIKSDVTAIQTLVSGHAALIAAETAARTAADTTLTTNVATNTANIATNTGAISTEATARAAADTTLQTSINTNTSNITTNTAGIAANTTAITGLKGHFGIVKDGGGYVTGWRINDDSASAGNFKLSTLNNDTKLQNPGYVGKYFPSVPVLSFLLPVTYDTQWGIAANNDFQGTDLNNYTRSVNVYTPATVGLSGSHFLGTDYVTGGSTQRLGQVLTTFKVKIAGGVNRYLSLWYRVKATTGTTTGRWFPALLADNTIAGQGTYTRTSAEAVIQISVTAAQVIEFGVTVLNTLNATVNDATNVRIYGGNVTVEAYNLVTIS